MTRCSLVLTLLVALSGCQERSEAIERVTLDRSARRAPAAERMRVEVVRKVPHDTDAFTQGLVIDEGRLFESTGLVGKSRVREVDLDSGRELRRREIPEPFFGEGLAKVGRELIVLTWKSGRAFRYDAETFELMGEHEYEGEGWGLTFDGERLIMSDGSAFLQFRDPQTFALKARLEVRLDGRPVRHLNELELAGGLIYANVWQTDRIVAIDPSSGEVRRTIDARGLLGRTERWRADVLNGIAHDASTGEFFLTGKLWPWLFQVRFVPAEGVP
jgi:glutaminyl-peptide cyclotransferase